MFKKTLTGIKLSCEPYHFKIHILPSGCFGSPWLISILFLHWLFLIAIMLLCLLRFWFLTIALIYISLYCWTINGLECEAMHICVWIHSDQLFVVMYSYQCSSKLLFIICGIVSRVIFYIFLTRFTPLKVDFTLVCLSFAVNMARIGNVNADEFTSSQCVFLLCPEWDAMY
jgi:hypothetical protein